MTSIPGVDYAWSHPGGAALKAAGKKFACRYLSPDGSKNLSRSEADDLAGHGVSCVVVWESTASRAKAGKAAGVADAKTAAIQAASAGMPGDRPIYFAVDFDATPGDQTAINAYLDGAASVIGRDRVGIYGGYYPVKRALDAKKVTWAWQTIAWSGGQWDERAVIRQGAQTSIGGTSCDLNTATATDYGQWMPGKTPTVEDDMPTPADVWDADEIPASAPPYNNSDWDKNKKWTASYALGSAVLTGRKNAAKLDALEAQAKSNGSMLSQLSQKVDALTVGGVDLDALAVKVADLLAERLAK